MSQTKAQLLDPTGDVTYSGHITGVGATFSGNLDVTGNVSVGGTLTKQDVTNVDSVGIITARKQIVMSQGYQLEWKNGSTYRSRIHGDSGNNFIIETGSSNTERLRVKDNGNTGIGTNNPTAPLDVYSSTAATNKDLLMVRSTTGAFGVQCSSIAAANPEWRLRTYSSEPIVLSPGNIEAVRIKANGKVGIGTDAIDANLSIHTNTPGENVFAIHADLGTNNNRTFNLYAPATDSGDDPYIFQTGNSIQFKVDSHQGIKIHTNGKVGIGITEPKQPLSIAGRTNIDVNNDHYGVWADGSTSGENHISVGRWYNTGGGLKSGYSQYGINNLILENNHPTAAHWLIIQPNGQKVAIGTHIHDGLVHIGQLSAGSVSADADADELVLESSANTGMSILSPGTGESSIYFGNPGTNGQKDAWIKYYHETHSTTANRRALAFRTSGTERLRIASSGQIGIAGANYGTDGQVLTSKGSGAAVQWADAGGVWTQINSQQISSSVSQVDVSFGANAGITTSYAQIKVYYDVWLNSGDKLYLRGAYGFSGTFTNDVKTSDYWWSGFYHRAGESSMNWATQGENQGSALISANSNKTHHSGEMLITNAAGRLYDAGSVSWPALVYNTQGYSGGDNDAHNFTISGHLKGGDNNPLQGIRVYGGQNIIAGEVRTYGLAH